MVSFHRAQATLVALLLFISTSAFAKPFSSLYVIGDSLSDPGNLLALTTAAHAGNPAVPIVPPPPYFQGRFSNGRNASEYLADNLGLSPNQVRNFAIGGATTGVGNVLDGGNAAKQGILGLPGVDAEMALLKQLIAGRGGHADSGALYMYWAGANDVFSGLFAGPGTDFGAIAQAIANNTFDDLKDLLSAGARHILLPNAPDFGLTPRFGEFGPQGRQFGAGIAQGINIMLAERVDELEQLFPNADIVEVDIFALNNDLIANPTKYGVPGIDGVNRCFTGNPLGGGTVCNDPDNHFYWDEVHPSARIHQILGGIFTDAVVPVPATPWLVIVGIGALGWARRRQG